MKKQQNDSLVPTLPAKMKLLLILAKTFEIKCHMKIRVNLKYPVNDCVYD